VASHAVKVRLFASLRERAGTDRLRLVLPAGATVGEALDLLAASPRLAGALPRESLVLAVNRRYASERETLRPGDELALIPPIAGGAPLHARVTGEPLSLDRLTRLVTTPGTGAVVSFQGVTRDVERLEYEAYAEMAEPRIAAILASLAAAHGLEGIAAEHRTGAVPRGEPSVIVAVAARHRPAAFAAARAAIDRIKAEAPIWKREVEGASGIWVEGTTPPPDQPSSPRVGSSTR
jgi:molybdopterin synthase catalytic subunit